VCYRNDVGFDEAAEKFFYKEVISR
jgi:hypothetical protein